LGKGTVAGAIRAALLTTEPRDKVMTARRLARDWRADRLDFVFDAAMPDVPGRPGRPQLLPPRDMPRRGRAQSLRGRTALLHAIAHIEFVAIDLALDIAGRFGAEMGPGFVGDFLDVAAEEAMHFVLLDRRLRAHGSHYGALPAHEGLWSAAAATAHDVAARLAVVPMALEARGLDVTPAMIGRLLQAGDRISARVLQRILDDEIRHVACGTKWFVACCRRRGETPEILWNSLIRVYVPAAVHPPFNDSAREAAGLSRLYYATVA
jgi:uncharacterized ferritin-like protein (DUF455 family)